MDKRESEARLPVLRDASPLLIEGMRDGCYSEPYKMLVVGSYESVTYGEAYYRTLALAGVLADEWDIGPASTVVLSANNVCWYVVVAAAVQLRGARLVLVSGNAELSDFEGAFEQCNPSLVIVASAEHSVALKGLSGRPSMATLSHSAEGIVRIEDAVAHAMAEARFAPDAPAGDPAIVLFSSGSTGKPKAIVNRSSSFRRSGLAQARVLGAVRDDVCYIPVPFSHTYGVVSLYTALETGCTVVTNVKYRPDLSLASISSLKATLYFGVPTMYLRELTQNADGAWDVSCLRAGLVAGSSCPEAVFAEYEQRYGCVLAQCYGMTETAATLTTGSLADPTSARAHTVGTPIDGAEVRIDPETGEICCRTPSLMSGIIREDGSLDPCLDEEGWFHSGDVGVLDEAGRLSITGRIKDIIIRGGINVFPAEVENVYQDNEAVSASCLVGYPDPELGERTCLCVVMEPGCDVSSHDLREYARGKVEKCKIPDVVLKMDDLPRLGNGKIDKKTLRAQVPALLKRPLRGARERG